MESWKRLQRRLAQTGVQTREPLALGLAFFLIAVACIVFTREVGRVAAVWPGNALAVAWLLRRPGRNWPALLAAAMVGCLAANIWAADTPQTAVLLAICNGAEILLCSVLTRRFTKDAVDLSRTRDLLVFGAVVAGVAVPAPGLVAAAIVAQASHQAYGEVFRAWYFADALGLLIVTPALLVFGKGQGKRKLGRAAITRMLLCFGVLFVSLTAVFGQTTYPLLFLALPALVLCAFQLGAEGAALALLLTATIAVVATLTGYGPAAMIKAGLAVRLGVLQVFLATMTLVVLPLSAVLAERRRLERSLRSALAQAEINEQRLQLASQITGIGYWRRESPSGDSVWSDETYALHGVTREAYAHRLEDSTGLYLGDDQLRIVQTVAAAEADGKPFDLKVRLRRQNDGEVRTVRFKGEAERNVRGDVIAIFGVIRDITDEETARQRVEESEARFRLLAESATDVILHVDQDDCIQFVSPSVRRYGYAPEDMVGRRGAEFVHPDDLAMILERVGRIAGGQNVDQEADRAYRVLKADGDYAWMEGKTAVIRDQAGQQVGLISHLRDVTERRASGEALASSEARYRLLADNSTDVIACYGQDAILTFLSPAVTALLGYEMGELLGKPISAFMHPDDLKASMRACRALLDPDSGISTVQFEYRAVHKNGSEVWLEAHPRAIRDPDSGAFIEFQDVVRDVSARKQLEADLLAARDAAEDAAAVKAEFMANMSHEIRTPLTAILGFTALIAARSDLPEDVAHLVHRTSGASQALLGIVNDILDFSKLEAGQMSISVKPTSALETLSDALGLFEPLAAAKGLKLVFEGAEGVPSRLSLDPDRVRQVLLNLIGNAVKFTDAGTITLSTAYDLASQRLRVSVRDTGAGMDAEQQSRLFQRFSQVDGSSTRRHGGTGLGLAICRGLVAAMGGVIELTSVVGQGSVFTLDIPAQACAPPEANGAISAPEGISGLRVLLADDNPLNRELAKSILTPFGVEVTDVADGAEALDMARAQPFDVILLDLWMPRMDGPQAALRIRAEPGPNQDVTILAFSADYDVERFGEQGQRGFDGLVRKPIEVEHLLQALADAVAWEPPARDEPTSAVG